MKHDRWPAPYVVIPWAGHQEFQSIIANVEGKSVVTYDRWWVLYSLLKQKFTCHGDVAEAGVYRGGTAYLLASVIRGWSDKRLFLFDTFSGIPPGTPGMDNRYLNGGEFSDTSEESVRNYVLSSGISKDRVGIRAGVIPKTLQDGDIESGRFCFVHLDVDIYRSVMDGLEFFWPRMSPGGVIVIDDYGFPECQGAYTASEEFGRRFSVPPISLGTGQAIFIKS